jgi:HK97 gp10 family phage protein
MKNGLFSLAEAAAKFAHFGESMKLANEAILTEWAATVRDKAKAAIGTYKYKWPPLGPAAVAKHSDTPLLDTGELRDSISAMVEMRGPEHGHAVVGSTSEIAVWQELGTSRIPPRSFLAASAKQSEKDLQKIARKYIRAAWHSAGHDNELLHLLHAIKLVLEVAKEVYDHSISK